MYIDSIKISLFFNIKYQLIHPNLLSRRYLINSHMIFCIVVFIHMLIICWVFFHYKNLVHDKLKLYIYHCCETFVLFITFILTYLSKFHSTKWDHRNLCTATSVPFHSSYLLPLYLTLNDISWGPSSSDHTIGQCLSLTVHVCQLSFLLLQLLLEVGGLCAQRIHRVLTSINPQSLRCHFPQHLCLYPEVYTFPLRSRTDRVNLDCVSN